VGGVLASAILVSVKSRIKRAESRKVEQKVYGRRKMRLRKIDRESGDGEENR
jgi:hypothetical protein